MARKIKIGRRIYSREEIFRIQEMMIRERAKLPFEEKIKALIRIQKLARTLGKDVFVWEVKLGENEPEKEHRKK